MCNPTAGSPTITLFQLHSNCHTRLESQTFNTLAAFVKFQLTYARLNSNKLKKFLTYVYKSQSNFRKIQLFERDGRCVQSLIYHSP